MLRSCYLTQARFYNGDPTADDIEWFFVPPGTPFLNKESAINSLNWVDLKERVDDPTHAGEVVGAPRVYTKGNYNISYGGLSAHGTVADFKGNGIRPPSAGLDGMGIPLVCGNAAIGPISQGNFPQEVFPLWNGVEYPTVTMWQVNSNLGYEDLSFGFNNWAAGSAFTQLDLAYANPNPSGTNYYVGDFSICDFPGYAPFVLSPQAIIPNAGNTAEAYIDPYPSWTYSGGPIVPGHGLVGWVVWSDTIGNILAFWPLLALNSFNIAGDTFSFAFEVDAAPWTY